MARYTSTLSTFNRDDTQSLESTVVAQQEGITSLQNQLSGIQSEVTDINSGLQVISGLIQRDTLEEQTRLLQERNREKLLTEARIRLGAESEVEKRVTGSLVGPLKNLEPKVTSVFDRVTESLKNLFFGFLAPGIIQGIGGIARFGIKGLTNVKTAIAGSFGFIRNSIVSLKNGLGGIITSLGNVTRKVSGIALKLAKSPIKAIAELFKSVPKLLGGAGAAAATGAGAAVAAGGGLLDDILKGLKKIAPPAVVGGVMTGLDIAGGEDPGRAIAGATGGMVSSAAAFGLGSLIPLPGTGVVAGAMAYDPGQKVAKKAYDFFKGGQSLSLPNIANQFNLNFDPSKLFGDKKTTQTTATEQNKTQSITSLTEPNPSKAVLSEPSPAPGATTNLATPTPIKVEPYKTPTPPKNLNNLPEPKPDVIVASTMSQAQNRIQNVQTKPLTDAPMIPSANTDNFYTLYAQTHYNVVI